MTQRLSVPGSDGSSRTRPTSTGSIPAASSGVGCPSPPSTSCTPGARREQLDRLSLRHRPSRNWMLADMRMTDVHRHTHAGHAHRQALGMEDLPALVERASTPPTCTPASRSEPASGITLPAIGRSHTSPARNATVERAGAAEHVGLSVALRPLLVELAHARAVLHRTPIGTSQTTSRSMPAARCSGASAATSTIVVQFGQDAMPFGMRWRSSGFTSGTTSGTSGSIRNAAELSTTCAPAAAATGAHLGRAGRRRRRSRGRARRSSRRAAPRRRPRRPRTGACGPPTAATRTRVARRPGTRAPRAMRSISPPTRPVAPTTPTFTMPLHRAVLLELERLVQGAHGPLDVGAPARRTRSGSTTWRSSRCSLARAARVSNIFAATPGCVFIPAPTSDTRPMSGSLREPAGFGLRRRPSP